MTALEILLTISVWAMIAVYFIYERQNKRLKKITQDQQITLNEHNLLIIPTIILNLRHHIANAINSEEYEKAKEYTEMIMKLEGFLEDDSVVINYTNK